MSSLGKGPWTTKLSSAGLVYAFYGKEAIAQLANKTDEKLLDKVYAKVIGKKCNSLKYIYNCANLDPGLD